MKNDKFPYEVEFQPSDVLRERYGFKKESICFREQLDVPFFDVQFACKHEDGTMESYFKADKGKPWEETLAKKLVEDKDAYKGIHFCHLNKPDGKLEAVSIYCLVYTNPKAFMFRPTVNKPISDAINVETDYTLEIRFAFDDGFLFSVAKTIKTQGPFCMDFCSSVEDIFGMSRHDPDEVAAFFEDCKNVRVRNDNGEKEFVIWTSSENTGELLELEFPYDSQGCHDIVSAICCIRIIDHKETITTRSFKDL